MGPRGRRLECGELGNNLGRRWVSGSKLLPNSAPQFPHLWSGYTDDFFTQMWKLQIIYTVCLAPGELSTVSS